MNPYPEFEAQAKLVTNNPDPEAEPPAPTPLSARICQRGASSKDWLCPVDPREDAGEVAVQTFLSGGAIEAQL